MSPAPCPSADAETACRSRPANEPVLYDWRSMSSIDHRGRSAIGEGRVGVSAYNMRRGRGLQSHRRLAYVNCLASSISTMPQVSFCICGLPDRRTRSTICMRQGLSAAMGKADALLQRQARCLPLHPCVGERLDKRPDAIRPGALRAQHRHHCADTPQAKGRVERANQTLHDRPVKELRLRSVDMIEAANVYALDYISDFNGRCSKQSRNPKDMHQPLADHGKLDGGHMPQGGSDPVAILDPTLRRGAVILELIEISRPLAGKKVVCD